MVPSWSRGVLVRSATLGLAVVVVLVGAWFVSGSTARTPTTSEPKTTAQKPHIAEVGPNLSGKPESASPKEPARTPGKPSSLVEAINHVEKAHNGKVTRGETTGEGTALAFALELRDSRGGKSRFKVTPDGTITPNAGTFTTTTPTQTRSSFTTHAVAVQPISLCDAVDLVEKAGKGVVVKAEQSGEGGATQFEIEVLKKDVRSRFVVNATGKTIVDAAESPRGKGKGGKEKKG